MQGALGGADKIAAVRDFEQIVRTEAWDQNGKFAGTAYKRVRFIRPSYLRIDQTGSAETYAVYFDGRSGWEVLADGKVATLAGSELRLVRNYLDSLNVIFWLADRDPKKVITCPGPNQVLVGRKGDNSGTIEVRLDPMSLLPESQTATSHSDANHPVREELRFEKWQVSDGVKFPRHLFSFHEGRKTEEGTVEYVLLNRGIKVSDLAVKPTEVRVKPVLAQP